jgi:DNA-binding NtrC family response regulator
MAMPSITQDLRQRTAESTRSLETDSSGGIDIAAGNGGWRKLLLQAEMVAPHLQIAAIEGEQGSGKQTIARNLHARSFFARAPFQRYDARAWLGSEALRTGPAGFVYLDRVDLLTAAQQAVLLEVVRNLQDLRRGSGVLVASSLTSLRHLASHRKFASDLAFRLTAVRFAIPPLRDRREDIAPLAQLLLDQICSRYQQPRVALEQGSLARLLQHNWPGNVRELTGVLQSAVLEARDGLIRAEDLQIAPSSEFEGGPKLAATAESLDLHAVIRHHVQYVLDLNLGNKLRSSRQLGISRSTLYRILADETVLGR